MLSTEDRIRQVFIGAVDAEEVSPRAQKLLAEMQDFTVSDFGINSVDAQALLQRIGDEFGIEIPAEDAARLDSLQALNDYINTRA